MNNLTCFMFKNKTLTISKSNLSPAELETFKSLVKLGDSENIALWTIEHMERTKKDTRKEYAQAYHS